EQGGLGGSLTDFCSLLEAASRHALRLPVASGFGIPAILLGALQNTSVQPMLASIAQGEMNIQPVVLDPGACDLRFMQDTLRAGIEADGSVVLNGQIGGVEQVPGSSAILLVCPSDGALTESPDSNHPVIASLEWR